MGVSSKLFFSCHTIFIEVYTHHTHITAAYEMFYKDDDARGLLAVTFFFFLFMYILIMLVIMIMIRNTTTTTHKLMIMIIIIL